VALLLKGPKEVDRGSEKKDLVSKEFDEVRAKCRPVEDGPLGG